MRRWTDMSWRFKEPHRHEWRKEIIASAPPAHGSLKLPGEVFLFKPDGLERLACLIHGSTSYLLTCECGETRTYTVPGTPTFASRGPHV